MVLRIQMITLLSSILLTFAGIMMVTMPNEAIPSLAWRVHFGTAIWAMGCIGGIGIWSFLQSQLST